MDRSVRIVTTIDGSGEVKIPTPADLAVGAEVEVEAVFHSTKKLQDDLSWPELVSLVWGGFADNPLEIPIDLQQEPLDFE